MGGEEKAFDTLSSAEQILGRGHSLRLVPDS